MSESDKKVEWIKQRKYLHLIHNQIYNAGGSVKMAIPRSIIHVGSCDAFSQIFNKYPEIPIIIYLHAEWCAPCRSIEPLWKRLAEEYAGRVFFLEANIDICKDIMQRFRVMGVPTFLVFHRWSERFRLTGAQSYSTLKTLIHKTLSLVQLNA